jgi:hypothetical protein
MPDKMLDLVVNNPVVQGVPKEFYRTLGSSIYFLATSIGVYFVFTGFARFIRALRG